MKELKLGPDLPAPDAVEKKRRIEELETMIEKYIPEFAKAVADTAGDDKQEMLVLHQGAFAGGYDGDEYLLLGMAVKFAGLRGISLNIIGINCETLGNGEKIETRIE